MMIQVKSTSVGDDVMAKFSTGRKGKNASYDLQDRGTLIMTAGEWLLFKRTLERGASRPVIFVNEAIESDQKKVDDDTAELASPF